MSVTLQVRVDEELRDGFTEVCELVEMSTADVIRGFMKRAVLFPEYMAQLKDNIERQEAGADKEDLRVGGERLKKHEAKHGRRSFEEKLAVVQRNHPNAIPELQERIARSMV